MIWPINKARKKYQKAKKIQEKKENKQIQREQAKAVLKIIKKIKSEIKAGHDKGIVLIGYGTIKSKEIANKVIDILLKKGYTASIYNNYNVSYGVEWSIEE